MSTRPFSLFCFLLFFAACSELETGSPAPDAIDDLRPLSLKQGISPLLTKDQLKRFTSAELQEMDRFLMDPYADLETRGNDVIRIPAGSVDALANAISQAPNGGMVVLAAGLHTESATVTVNKRIRLVGEPGAVLEAGTAPMETIGFVQPVIHIKGASGVSVSRLTLRSTSPIGGTAILVENAPRTVLSGNTITGFQFGIVIENSDRNWIAFNTVHTSPAWMTGEIIFATGLININGERNGVMGNTFTNSFLGSFTSSKDGIFIGNELYGNAIGALLCKVPALVFPDQTVHQAEITCKDWLYVGNSSHDNFSIGYLIIDGANENELQGNKAAGNADYDIELAGESSRFGFPTPECFNNRVVAREHITVKDCGSGNTVVGGTVVDTALNPCF